MDHRTPTEERDWAVKGYLPKRQMIGKIYEEIEYDEVMLRTRSQVCKLNGHDYPPEIRKVGGAPCHAGRLPARVGKSLEVPAAYVRGESQDLELHAWVMWVEVKAASKTSVNSQPRMFGYRYRGDNYYTANSKTRRPATILDRDMERRLCGGPGSKWKAAGFWSAGFFRTCEGSGSGCQEEGAHPARSL